MPAEVYLIPDVNAWVSQRGGIMGFGSRRVVGIGLPLLETLTVSQLKAVIAHEFGHYYRGDTKLGPWVYKTRGSIIRTVVSLKRHSVLRLPFVSYGKMFLRITQGISRCQEYSADEVASKIAGSQNMMTALRVIQGTSPAWQTYWKNEVAPALNYGFVPPVAEGFGHFTNVKSIAQQVSQIVDKQASNQKTDPYDSHPSLHDRLIALGNLAAGPETSNELSAITLLENVTQLEYELLLPIAKRANIQNLKAVNWDELLERVYLPSWKSVVSQQEAVLTGLTPRALPERSRNMHKLEERLSGAEKMSPKNRSNLIISAVGAALSLGLIKQGWTAQKSPGEPVSLSKDGKSIQPFSILPMLTSGNLSWGDWLNTCTECGILNLNLDPRSPDA